MKIGLRHLGMPYLLLIVLVVITLMAIPVHSAEAATLSSWLAHEGQTIQVTNLEGSDRYSTNADIVKSNFSTDEVNVTILASGENFPDALSASTLSGALNAPIVLVGKNDLPAAAVNTLKAIKPKRLIVVGSTGAISKSVVAKAEQYTVGKSITTRLGGKDRYETNAKIYSYLVKKCKVDPSQEIILASGENFPDALSMSSYAAATKTPIVLCNSGKGIAAGLKKTLSGYRGQVTIAGGIGAVSKQNANWFSKATKKRLGGADRYETSYLIANYALKNGLGAKNTLIATGANFPDALSGSSLGSKLFAPIMLVDGSKKGLSKSEHVYRYCSENDAKIENLYYLGGKGVINGSKRAGIKDLLKAWTITFNWDGKTTTTKGVRGMVPKTPSPKGYEDKVGTHTFIGWDKTIKPATGSATYSAKYSTLYKTYTVTWKGFDTFYPDQGKTVYNDTKTQTYRYGEKLKVPNFSVKLTGAGDGTQFGSVTTWNLPQKQAGSYCFNGWDKTLPQTVTSNMTFTAKWVKVVGVGLENGGYGKGDLWPTSQEIMNEANKNSPDPFKVSKWAFEIKGPKENIGGYTVNSLLRQSYPGGSSKDVWWREMRPWASARGKYQIVYYCLYSLK